MRPRSNSPLFSIYFVLNCADKEHFDLLLLLESISNNDTGDYN